MSDQSKLSLRSLTIHRYEQFRNCPRIELSPDDNLILGINGSGKTSLLRLLAAVLRWNYDALLGQPFDIEFEQVLDEGLDTEASISGRVKYEPTPVGADPRSPGRRAARTKYEGFEARFEIRRSNGASIEVVVCDSALQVVHQNGDPADARAIASWLAEQIDAELKEIKSWHLAQRADAVFLVRETEADFLRLTERVPYDYLIEFASGDWVSFEPELLDMPEDRQWGALVAAIVTGKAAVAEDLEAYLQPLTFYPDVEPYLDMSSVLMALDAESLSFRLKIGKSQKIMKTESVGERIGFDGKGVEIRVRFASGTEVVDSRLTFGQKRLITIALGALLCGGSPLLVDELDNGLHPGLVEEVLGLIRGRQTFIASHNKLVVDLLDYESPEDMRRTIHICRRNQDGTQSLVALSDEQVREVFEKIEVGIMNPSDVLLTEGLW